MKNEITIKLNKNQLSEVMDYFYACEEVAQSVDEQPKYTEKIQQYHNRILEGLSDSEVGSDDE